MFRATRAAMVGGLQVLLFLSVFQGAPRADDRAESEKAAFKSQVELLETVRMLQDKCMQANHAIEEAVKNIANPAVRNDAIDEAKREIYKARQRMLRLAGGEVSLECPISLEESPYRVVALGASVQRDLGDQFKWAIQLSIYQFKENGELIAPQLVVDRHFSKEKYKTLNGQETVRVWGWVESVKCDESGIEVEITVRGLVVRDPWGEDVERKNELDGYGWEGQIKYDNGGVFDAFVGVSGRQINWKCKEDAYAALGIVVGVENKSEGNKQILTIRYGNPKTNTQIRGIFIGKIHYGFVYEGTFIKDRLLPRQEKFAPNGKEPDLFEHPEAFMIDEKCQGSFRFVNYRPY